MEAVTPNLQAVNESEAREVMVPLAREGNKAIAMNKMSETAGQEPRAGESLSLSLTALTTKETGLVENI